MTRTFGSKMKSTDSKTHGTPIGWLVFRLGLLAFASAVVVAVSLFGFSIVSEGIDAKLMTFESEPAQGWGYWERKHQIDALKGWAIPLLLAAGALFILLRSCYKTIRSIVAALTNHQAEQDDAGKPDPAVS